MILEKVLTREQIAERIIKHGDLLVIYDGKVYRLNSWINKHPGGDLVIFHMIGKDATDEMNAYHPDDVLRRQLKNFYFADLDLSDKENYQSLNPSVYYHLTRNDFNNNLLVTSDILLNAEEKENFQRNAQIVRSYRQLMLKLRFLGLFECNYWEYARESVRYFFLAFLSIYFFHYAKHIWHYSLSAVFLGAFWHQLTFTAHDAGHLSITHQYRIDTAIGILIANFLGGISIGWWKHHHNVHHLVTNSPEHDPDIQHLPFFAVTPRFFQSIYSTYYKKVIRYDWLSSWFLRVQHFSYYIVMCFARFNLQLQSYLFLYKNRQSYFYRLEVLGIVFYWCCFSLILFSIPSLYERLAFFLISYAVTMPLHVQITLSHFGMSTEDLGPNESFPSKMLRTTMDIACPTWMDFFHGGLQYQAVHHLFPRLPRHQLRPASFFVKQFADEVGLEYHVYGFVNGNAKVLSVLKDVASQIDLFNKAIGQNHEH